MEENYQHIAIYGNSLVLQPLNTPGKHSPHFGMYVSTVIFHSLQEYHFQFAKA